MHFLFISFHTRAAEENPNEEEEKKEEENPRSRTDRDGSTEERARKSPRKKEQTDKSVGKNTHTHIVKKKCRKRRKSSAPA
jgi:FtsZ-interacting cell division protein YlmF